MKQAIVLALVLTTLASGARAQMLDHLKCHKMKDLQRLKATIDFDALEAEFTAQGCLLTKPKFFCVPGTKSNVQPPDVVKFNVNGQELQNDFICYSAKCPTLPPDTGVTDQFGTRTETHYKTSLICTPAIQGTVTTTTTTPGQTTTTISGGSTCGTAAFPECNGPCSTPGNICISTGSGCGCVASTAPCGSVQGPPTCGGACSGSTPWCKNIGGTCTCSANP
jgi:hypothetical protein